MVGAIQSEVSKQAAGHRPWASRNLIGFGDEIQRGTLVVVSLASGGRVVSEHNGSPVRIEAFGKHRAGRKNGGRVWVVAYAPHLRSPISFHVEGPGWRRSFKAVGYEKPVLSLTRKG